MFSINMATGLVDGARQVNSPNYDDRPTDCAPSLIVIHGISLPPGEYGGPEIDLFFTNDLPAEAHPYFEAIADVRVSAHFLIRRDGELVQYVSVGKRAWHAGESCYDGRDCCNDFSIGIELEGEDHIPYEQSQYECLAALVGTLRSEHSALADAKTVGHSDIAPGRKTDPGEAFDWVHLRGLLGES
jgi:AmpD protein